MKLYFDTEFTGLHKETTLISIGIVTEGKNYKSFYAELTDYDRDQCDDWIKKNVLQNLENPYKLPEQEYIDIRQKYRKAHWEIKKKRETSKYILFYSAQTYNVNSHYECTNVCGNKDWVVEHLKRWLLESLPKEELQFVSDVSHYDFTLLIDLFGNAFGLPDNVSVCCHDINQDIARFKGITDKAAFNYSRE